MADSELNSNEEPHVLPPKRKQTSQTLDDDATKKLRPDNEPPAAVEYKPIADNDGKHEIEDEEEEDYNAEDEIDSEDEDDDDEDEHSNGESEIDRKGKGIMKDDKGKGKMIEESDDDDDDDSDGGAGDDDDGDDDFSDDPLAEVDLDNILPSRTRRRTATRGVQISGGEVADDKENDA